MCCKLLEIAELAKPANHWCDHVTKAGGCSIYVDRPDVCRGYLCAWMTDESLGDEWKPERCKFTMHRVQDKLGLWVNVDASRPLAWKQPPYYDQIKAWSNIAREANGYVAVCMGTRTFVVFPEEDLLVPDIGMNHDLRVGYRHADGARRPLVLVRDESGSVTEHLGALVDEMDEGAYRTRSWMFAAPARHPLR